MYCLECNNDIHKTVFTYSMNEWGYALCKPCQNWIREKEDGTTTQETITLYFELKKRKIPAKLEKFDGFKSIDIAIPKAFINIEVDGAHHNFNAKQAMSDLKRTYHSFLKGFMTFRIPNTLVRQHLDETADHLAEIIRDNMKR